MPILLFISCSPGGPNKTQKVSQIQDMCKLQTITIETGNKDFRGAYTMNISKEGSEVIFNQGELEKSYKSESSEVFLQAQSLIKKTDPKDLKSNVKNATPGDELIIFNLTCENEPPISSKLWVNEQWENEDLKEWFEFFKKSVKSISKEELTYK